MTRRASAVLTPLAVLCLLLSGCGSDDPQPGPTADAQIEAGSNEDRQIGLDLQDYLLRNCPQPGETARIPRRLREDPAFPRWHRWYVAAKSLCGSIASIEVDDSRVTVHSGLADDAAGRAAGAALCNLIQGSDVADFTPGHELQGADGETITVCPAEAG